MAYYFYTRPYILEEKIEGQFSQKVRIVKGNKNNFHLSRTMKEILIILI